MKQIFHSGAGDLKAAETDARQASARQGMLEAAEAELSGAVARLERKVALLTKERTMLKEIVDSYDAEEAIHGGKFPWHLSAHTSFLTCTPQLGFTQV